MSVLPQTGDREREREINLTEDVTITIAAIAGVLVVALATPLLIWRTGARIAPTATAALLWRIAAFECIYVGILTDFLGIILRDQIPIRAVVAVSVLFFLGFILFLHFSLKVRGGHRNSGE